MEIMIILLMILYIIIILIYKKMKHHIMFNFYKNFNLIIYNIKILYFI